jgi:hypothetical protein
LFPWKRNGWNLGSNDLANQEEFTKAICTYEVWKQGIRWSMAGKFTTDLIGSPTKIYVGIILAICRYGCYRRTHKQKQFVKKTLVDNLWIVGESIDNKHTDGFTNKQNTPKKQIYLLYVVDIFIGKYNISLIKFHR